MKEAMKNQNQTHYTKDTPIKSIDIYNDGFRLNCFHRGGNQKKGRNTYGDKKSVGKFSSKSRTNLRKTLLNLEIPKDHFQYSVCLTVPGEDVLKIDEIKVIKQKLSMYLKRVGVCAIWRAEIQQRGQIHFHITLGFPPDSKITYKTQTLKEVVILNDNLMKEHDFITEKFTNTKKKFSNKQISLAIQRQIKLREESLLIFDTLRYINHTSKFKFKSRGLINFPKQYDLFKEDSDKHFNNFLKIRKVWYRCLQAVSNTEVYDKETGQFVDYKSRENCNFANVYCIDIQILEKEYSAVKRYMQDHTSKSKQGQVGENIGRHWGVINRSAFEEKKFDEIIVKTKQGFAIRRWYNRLCIPYIKDSEALFKKKRGRSYRRGYNGSSVFFSNPETLQRMIEYAKILFPECSLKNL